jgi:hypothetical protein
MAFLAGAPTTRIEKVIRTGRFCFFKGTWSRDELEYSLQAWVNIGLNKGRGSFIIFSNASHTEIDSFVFCQYLFIFLICQDTRPLLPTGWKNLQILRCNIWSLTIMHCFGLVLFVILLLLLLGNYTPHVISNGCKKKTDKHKLSA